DHMQAVSAADSPARNNSDDRLAHKADQALQVQYIKAGCPCGVLISPLAPYALIAAGTEGPAAIFGSRPFAGKQGHPGMLIFSYIQEGLLQFKKGFWTKSITDFGPVDGNAGHTLRFFKSDIFKFFDSFPVHVGIYGCYNLLKSRK